MENESIIINATDDMMPDEASSLARIVRTVVQAMPAGTELPDQWAPLDNLIDGQWAKGSWSGIPRLECIRCQWDTLDGIGAAREHATECPRCHPAIEIKEPSQVLVADKHGKEKTQ